ncbi:stage III sporulation protein AG [Paracerasibacillus soli]|uniref:Stage III sporulation protein AG n=1 Tax=Paracerasibacillus soli TaxID=480284 RepID=A0ABU5CRG6_9BACI|nr:stage III sporulation protein AG [Virgibacillus soli]MDY0408402.1 stage III sporulation protein AG [Virgibacillus soli]
MINKIKEWLQFTDDNQKNKRPLKSYVILIGLLGLLFMILGNVFSPSKKEDQVEFNLPKESNEESTETNANSPTMTADVNELETTYKKQLEAMLENIQGVSNVEVMINLDSTNVKVYEKNLITGKQLTDENDKNGGNRQIEDNTEETQVVVVRQGDKETPLLVQTKNHQYEAYLL